MNFYILLLQCVRAIYLDLTNNCVCFDGKQMGICVNYGTIQRSMIMMMITDFLVKYILWVARSYHGKGGNTVLYGRSLLLTRIDW